MHAHVEDLSVKELFSAPLKNTLIRAFTFGRGLLGRYLTNTRIASRHSGRRVKLLTDGNATLFRHGSPLGFFSRVRLELEEVDNIIGYNYETVSALHNLLQVKA